jgi:hypothetical protein
MQIVNSEKHNNSNQDKDIRENDNNKDAYLKNKSYTNNNQNNQKDFDVI